MELLNSVLTLNSTVVLRVQEHKIILKVYQDNIVVPFNSFVSATDINDVLVRYKGKRVAIINSDVLGVTDMKVKIKMLEKHLIARIQKDVLNTYIPYLAIIGNQENTEILIQSSYDTSKHQLTITAGLVNDVQVLLFDIHYENMEGD